MTRGRQPGALAAADVPWQADAALVSSGRVVVRSESDLPALLDRPLDCPEVMVMTQERITGFADVVEDHQWIHVERERCTRESAFGTTIAHGFLTLSLIGWFLERTLVLEGGRMSINYGLDKVRFIRPVRAGTRLRGRFVLIGIDEHDWGVHLSWDAAVTDEADDPQGWIRPALAARWLTRWYR